MVSRVFVCALLATLVGCDDDDAGPERYPLDDVLRLGQIQAKGTHNSYHRLDGPASLSVYDYTFDPIPTQLADQGVRQLELDLHRHRDGNIAVYHVPILDPDTSCFRFADCLSGLVGWSSDSPGHHPLFVFIEPKDDYIQLLTRAGGDPNSVDELVWDGELGQIDEAIRAAIAPERLFTPDDLLAGHASLSAALAADGWPTLGAVRDRFIFIMLAGGDQRREYTADDKGLSGRAMFVTADADAPYAAFVKLDDPVAQAAEIADAVAAGLIVRTRADVDGTPNPARAEAALASGAHLVSTDFSAPREAGGYVFDVPGGSPSRCNPVTAPADCTAADVEALEPR